MMTKKNNMIVMKKNVKKMKNNRKKDNIINKEIINKLIDLNYMSVFINK